MEVIELVRRDENDPLARVMYESHKLVSFVINNDDPLGERFKDTRTPYEQYREGEKYLKYNDKTLYSRSAHEFMFHPSRCQMFPIKNFKIGFDDVL